VGATVEAGTVYPSEATKSPPFFKYPSFTNVRKPYINKLTFKFKNLSQLIDDNRFIWILSFEDVMVYHALSNLLHSLFEKSSKQLKNLKQQKSIFITHYIFFFIV
jgi:hypothetical protein